MNTSGISSSLWSPALSAVLFLAGIGFAAERVKTWSPLGPCITPSTTRWRPILDGAVSVTSYSYTLEYQRCSPANRKIVPGVPSIVPP